MELRERTETFTAGADLSAKRYYVVKITSQGVVGLAGAGEGFGLLHEPGTASGSMVGVVTRGIYPAIAGGNITLEALVTSDVNGKIVDAVATDEAIGRARMSGVAGDLVEVDLYRSIVA